MVSSNKQKALFLTEKQGPYVVGPASIPTPESGQLLIKVYATGLNPIDWKIQDWGLFVENYPVVLGNDFAGEVVELGKGVTGFQKGDKVFVQGQIGRSEFSGYQQYALAEARITGKIPPGLTYEQAASIPVGLTTAAVGLFNETDKPRSVGFYPPWKEGGHRKYAGTPILVLAGASCVGQYVLQLAKLAGFSPIITTASLHNTEFLTALGATHVLSRTLSQAELAAEIVKITNKPLTVIYDAVSSPQVQNDSFDILAPGGTLATVGFVEVNPEKIESAKDKRVVAIWGFGNAPENWELVASLYSQLAQLVEEGAIKPNRVETLPNGLEGIVGGLKKLKEGKVSGVKLVARPQETP